MKSINKYLLLLAAAVFSFTACDKQAEREPSPVFSSENAVFFPTSSASLEVDPADVFEYTIKVGRVSKDTTLAAFKAHINVLENTDDVFEVPDSVEFALGATDATILVKFPNAQIDVPYTLSIVLDNEEINPYLDKKPTFDLSITLAKWDLVTDKKAIVFDGIINAWYVTGAPGWYVPYARKNNADGSFDIRLLNPYTILPEYRGGNVDDPIADEFGLYGGYPFNYPADVDSQGTYNMIIHVDKKGNATFDGFYLGMDWGSGMFYARFYDATKPGVYDKENQSITFIAGSSASFRGESGRYTTEPIIVFLDDALWKDINSAIKISGLEDGFNDASISWNAIPGGLSTLESSIQPGLIELVLENAIDPNPEDKQGPESDFYNLYRLADAYAPDHCLAFYWDTIKGQISLPVDPQPTGLVFAGKDILVAPSATNESYVEDVVLQGVDVKKFHFFLQVQTPDGGNLGEFEEVFYFSVDPVVFGEKAEDFAGNYVMVGKDQWSGAESAFGVEIKFENNELYLLGITYADTIWMEFDDATKKLSITPQQLGDYGPYDIAFYTSTEQGGSVTEPLVLAMGFGGIIKTDASSNADGFYLVSQAAGGAVLGYYDLVFTPSAPSQAPRRAAAEISLKGDLQHSARPAVAPKTANFKLQGKVPAHNFRQK